MALNASNSFEMALKAKMQIEEKQNEIKKVKAKKKLSTKVLSFI